MPLDIDCYCMAIRVLWLNHDYNSDCAISYVVPRLPDEYESMYDIGMYRLQILSIFMYLLREYYRHTFISVTWIFFLREYFRFSFFLPKRVWCKIEDTRGSGRRPLLATGREKSYTRENREPTGPGAHETREEREATKESGCAGSKASRTGTGNGTATVFTYTGRDNFTERGYKNLCISNLRTCLFWCVTNSF